MAEAHNKLARILRVSPEVLLGLEQRMDALTGKSRIINKIGAENSAAVEATLGKLGVTESQQKAENVYKALISRLTEFDRRLYEFLGKPRIEELSQKCGRLCEVALELNRPRRGFFITKKRGMKMLERFPPENILEFFGYRTVGELFRYQDFDSIFSSLRFVQDAEWMHRFFDKAYSDLTADDFEERGVELKVLEPQWLDVAEKFLEKKYHNVSHLKEFGVIFVIPLHLNTPGETLRMFSLILHYLNEVPFYSKLFRRFSGGDGFSDKLKSLLRGDVPAGEPPASVGGLNVRIVQRYLAKDKENDPRLFEPHVNPEAEHWFAAQVDLSKLPSLADFAPYKNQAGAFAKYDGWQDLNHVGDFFADGGGGEQLVSFDLIDLVMSLVKKGEIKYLYHQQEALWNQIFIEYLGRDKLEELVEENIVGGFIQL